MKLADNVKPGISNASTEDYLQNGHHPSDNVVRSDAGWRYHRFDSIPGHGFAAGASGHQ